MQETRRDGRRGNRQVKPRRQWYPVWGVDCPKRVWNGHSLYRGGQRSLLMRYIIPPREGVLLEMGVTVLDVLVGIAVGIVMVPIVMLTADVSGIIFDRCADRLGW